MHTSGRSKRECSQIFTMRNGEISHRDKSMPRAIERDTCQFPGGERSRIDVDAIWQYFRLLDRRVAVHYDFAEIRVAVEKLAADP